MPPPERRWLQDREQVGGLSSRTQVTFLSFSFSFKKDSYLLFAVKLLLVASFLNASYTAGHPSRLLTICPGC